MPNYSQLLGRLKVSWEHIPRDRRRGLVISLSVAVLASLLLLFWILKPSYRPLYSDLTWEEMAEIAEVLNQAGIPTKIDESGRRILVPAGQVYKARMKLAAKGLPREPGVGWELFDRTNLGVTDFVQKLNYRRSLEGELARTINQMDPVEVTRVHLVIPEETIFRENRREPTASVTIRLKRGRRLTPEQVEGITYLVSSAVEGLNPENVTVLDSRGNILSIRKKPDPLARLTSSQLELQQAVEQYLVEKGQSLLDKRFGPGRSALQVSAFLDFTQYERSSEIYDPDNPAVRSEEITTNAEQRGDTSSARQETQVTNYELSLTRERMVNAIGQIKRLTIAVMVDGHYHTINEGGKTRKEFAPLSPQELNEVQQTIAAALGYNPDRGDEISVVSIPFQGVDLMEEEERVSPWRWENVLLYGPKVLTGLVIVIFLLLIRSFFRRAIRVVEEGIKLPVYPPSPEEAPPAIPGAPQPSVLPTPPGTPGVKPVSEAQEQINKFVTENPELTARLVRAWITE